MTAEPPVVIARLVYRDPEDPGPQGTVPAKVADVPEDLEEHVLDYVGGVGGIVHQPAHHAKYRLFVAKNQRLVSGVIAIAQSSHQRGLLVPPGDPGQVSEMEANGSVCHGRLQSTAPSGPTRSSLVVRCERYRTANAS